MIWLRSRTTMSASGRSPAVGVDVMGLPLVTERAGQGRGWRPSPTAASPLASGQARVGLLEERVDRLLDRHAPEGDLVPGADEGRLERRLVAGRVDHGRRAELDDLLEQLELVQLELGQVRV